MAHDAADLASVVGALRHIERGSPELSRYRFEPLGRAEIETVNRTIGDLELADDVAHFLTTGGYWPGWPTIADFCDPDVIGLWFGPEVVRENPTTHAIQLGTISDRDHCHFLAVESAQPTSPILQISSSALCVAMVFPSLATLLDAFIDAIEVLGFTDRYGNPGVDPGFVHLPLMRPEPTPEVGIRDGFFQQELELHDRLAEKANGWISDHPLWEPTVMPMPWTDTVDGITPEFRRLIAEGIPYPNP
jgi:hypothetical protein